MFYIDPVELLKVIGLAGLVIAVLVLLLVFGVKKMWKDKRK